MPASNVLFLGAPSTGKTSLVKALAEHYQEPWMHELGKDYWIKHQIDRRLSQDQLLEIAELHLAEELVLLEQANRFLFTDTNAITTYMFALDYYGFVEEGLTQLAQSAEQRYDWIFVCDTDIPYEDTWERSGAVFRSRFQQMIIDDLNTRGLKYELLSGSLKSRIETVIDYLGA